MVMMAKSMPPKVGMAMGIMTSDPRPEEVNTGRRARIVVAMVIMAGRTRLVAASMMRSWICSRFSGGASLKRCSR